MALKYTPSVMDCCGVSGYDRLPPTKEQFFNEIGGAPYGGAFVIVFTADYQPRQEKYLAEIGFKPVAKNRNRNSGNVVTIWVIDRDDFISARNTFFRNNRNNNVVIETGDRVKIKETSRITTLDRSMPYRVVNARMYDFDYNRQRAIWVEAGFGLVKGPYRAASFEKV